MFSLLVVFAAIFITVWCGVIWLVANLGGWARLAEKYRCDDSFVDSWTYLPWGTVGGSRYKGLLLAAATAEGLYLKVGFLIRLWHPSLRIPWTAIESAIEKKSWQGRSWEIHLSGMNVPITLEYGALSEAQRFLGDKLKFLEKKS